MAVGGIDEDAATYHSGLARVYWGTRNPWSYSRASIAIAVYILVFLLLSKSQTEPNNELNNFTSDLLYLQNYSQSFVFRYSCFGYSGYGTINESGTIKEHLSSPEKRARILIPMALTWGLNRLKGTKAGPSVSKLPNKSGGVVLGRGDSKHVIRLDPPPEALQ